jgi:hypothetical protein
VLWSIIQILRNPWVTKSISLGFFFTQYLLCSVKGCWYLEMNLLRFKVQLYQVVIFLWIKSFIPSEPQSLIHKMGLIPYIVWVTVDIAEELVWWMCSKNLTCFYNSTMPEGVFSNYCVVLILVAVLLLVIELGKIFAEILLMEITSLLLLLSWVLESLDDNWECLC